MAVFMIFPLQTGAVFNVTGEKAQELLPGAIFMFSLCIPPTGMLFILRSHYQSTGYRNAATMLTILEGTVFFISVLWGLSLIDPNAVWLSHVISIILALAVMLLVMGIIAKRKGSSAVLLLSGQPDGDVYDFSIPNKIESAVEASRRVVEYCREKGVDEDAAYKIGVSVEELCVNSALYAAGSKSDMMDIFLNISPEAVVLKVRDNGKIFNPTEFIDDSGERITGLKLIRSITSEMEYNRVIGFNTTIITVDRK